MTTIRTTRLPRDRTPAPDPRPAPGSGGPAGGVRLSLIEPVAPRTALDGAWWPRSADLADELPALVEELHHRGIRITRVMYNPTTWSPAAGRLRTDDRIVRLGWFRTLDPHEIDMSGDLRRVRLDLLVVPPDTAPDVAARAFEAASARDNSRTATAVLEDAGA